MYYLNFFYIIKQGLELFTQFVKNLNIKEFCFLTNSVEYFEKVKISRDFENENEEYHRLKTMVYNATDEIKKFKFDYHTESKIKI